MNEQKMIDEVVLECTKRSRSISQLEKDILSINQLYMERPLDRMKATQKLFELDCRYKDITRSAKTM